MRMLDEPPQPVSLPHGATCTPINPKTLPDPSYKRASVNAVPATVSLAKKSGLPLGLLVCPYKSHLPGEDHVPTIGEIARCRRCRTYVNPFVQFVEAGRRWKCNMCFALNDCK